MYLLILLVGILIGILSKKIIIQWIKSILITKRNSYNIKFHVYFIMHQSGSRLNEVIKTNTIEISIVGKNENEAIDFLKDFINDEARIEIESIEVCN